MPQITDNQTSVDQVLNMTGKAKELFSSTEHNIQAVFLLLIIVIIIVGNTSLLFIIYHDSKLRTPMYILIASLALSDLGVGTSTAPLTLIAAFNNGQWLLGSSACTFQAMANSTFFIATMLNLMAMTMEKYFSIARPLSRFVTKTRTKRVVVLIWVLTLLFAILPLVGLGRYGLNSTTQSCGLAFPKTSAERVYLMLTLFLGFVMPLAVMCFANFVIFTAIKKHSIRVRRHVQGTAARAGISASQKNFTVTVLIILAVFIVSWTPFLFLAITAQNKDSAKEMPPFLGVIAYWCGYAASAWNPVIYVTRNRRIRNGALYMRDRLFCREPKTPSRQESTTSAAYSIRRDSNVLEKRI